jgi:hypothetical protein
MSVLRFAGRRPLRALAAATVLAGALVVPAFADSVTVSGTVAGTPAGMTSSNLTPSFGTATLNGTTQTISSAAFGLDITDNSGTLSGWKVTVDGPALSSATHPTYTPLAATAASGTATQTSTGGTMPTNSAAATVPLDGTTHTLFNAAAGSGMGEFTLAPTFTVTIPTSAGAATDYSSAVTVAFANSPT